VFIEGSMLREGVDEKKRKRGLVKIDVGGGKKKNNQERKKQVEERKRDLERKKKTNFRQMVHCHKQQ